MALNSARGNSIGAGAGAGDRTTRGDPVVTTAGNRNNDPPPVPENIKAIVRGEAGGDQGGQLGTGLHAGGLAQEGSARGTQTQGQGGQETSGRQTVVQGQDAAGMNVYADPARTRADLEGAGKEDGGSQG